MGVGVDGTRRERASHKGDLTRANSIKLLSHATRATSRGKQQSKSEFNTVRV